MLLRINKIFYFRRLQCTNLVTDNNVSISNRGSTRSLTATFILGLDMGWFFWSSGDKNTEPKPPDRQDRRKCWESRDAYFACLDAKGVVKPGDEGTACADVKKPYEKNCAKSWVRSRALCFGEYQIMIAVQVDYFNQRRVLAEQQKESLAMANSQAEEARRRKNSSR